MNEVKGMRWHEASRKQWRGKIKIYQTEFGDGTIRFQARVRVWSRKHNVVYWDDVGAPCMYETFAACLTAAQLAWNENNNQTPKHRPRKVWP